MVETNEWFNRMIRCWSRSACF